MNNVNIIREFILKILQIHGEMVEHFLRYSIDISSVSLIKSFNYLLSFFFSPQYIDIKQIYRSSNRENLTQAFEFAQKHYGITQLIDPEGQFSNFEWSVSLPFFLSDIDTDEPDEKSILLYISHLYKACPTLPNHPFRQEHDQVCDDHRRMISIDFFLCEIDSISRWIIKWIYKSYNRTSKMDKKEIRFFISRKEIRNYWRFSNIWKSFTNNEKWRIRKL